MEFLNQVLAVASVQPVDFIAVFFQMAFDYRIYISAYGNPVVGYLPDYFQDYPVYFTAYVHALACLYLVPRKENIIIPSASFFPPGLITSSLGRYVGPFGADFFFFRKGFFPGLLFRSGNSRFTFPDGRKQQALVNPFCIHFTAGHIVTVLR